MRYYLLTRSWRLVFLSAVIESVASRAVCCLPQVVRRRDLFFGHHPREAVRLNGLVDADEVV